MARPLGRSAVSTGHTDIPLTEEGEREAQELRARPRGLMFAEVLTSPLQRRRGLALLGFSFPLVLDRRLQHSPSRLGNERSCLISDT